MTNSIFVGILLLCALQTTNAQNYFNGTTYTINLGCNRLDYGGIEFSNNTSKPMVLHWEKVLEDTVPGSSFDMCANSACYITVPDTGSNWNFPVMQQDTGFFKLHYWTGDSAGTSTLKLYVYDKASPSTGDTLTYILNIVCSGLGVEENKDTHPFHVYPIPADQHIILEIKDMNVDDLYTVNLIDALGRNVLSERIKNTYLNRLNVGNIKNGVYFLQILNRDNEVLQYQKVIVNH